MGPTLFLVYTDDLNDGLQSKNKLLADDVKIYTRIRGIEDSQQLQYSVVILAIFWSLWVPKDFTLLQVKLGITIRVYHQRYFSTMHGVSMVSSCPVSL